MKTLLFWLAVLIFATLADINYADQAKPTPTPPNAGYSVTAVKPGLYEISLDIAVQEEADEAFFDRFATRMQEVSNLIWTLTQGQFYISNIKIKDKCSDGRIIVKRGTKDWEILAGPRGSGTGATCYEPHTTRWYVYAAGKPHPVILAHELFHGLFKFKDEDDCRCIMRGTQVVGYEITALCDDKSHKGTDKSCWSRLLERYPNIKYQPSRSLRSKERDSALRAPPPIKVTKEHRKEFETTQEEMINKTLQLEGAAIYFFESGNANKVIPVCLEKLKVRPDDAAAYYNIACAYALMDKPKEALENLKKAVDNGFDDYEWLKDDPDLVSLKDEPEFQKILKPQINTDGHR